MVKIGDIYISRKNFDYYMGDEFVEVKKKGFDYVCNFMNYFKQGYSDSYVYIQIGTGLHFAVYNDRKKKYYILKENKTQYT